MNTSENLKIEELLSSNEYSTVKCGLSLWEGFIQSNDWISFKKDLETIFAISVAWKDDNEISNLNEIVRSILIRFEHGDAIVAWLLSVLIDGFQMEIKYPTELHLYTDEVECLSKIIAQTKYLEELGLGLEDSELKMLPQELWELVNLKSLDVCGSKTQFLPPDIENLTELRELCLYETDLAYLPEELGKLGNLETLDITGNLNLGYWLPDCIYELKKLKSLKLGEFFAFDPFQLPTDIEVTYCEPVGGWDSQIILQLYKAIWENLKNKHDIKYFYDLFLTNADFDEGSISINPRKLLKTSCYKDFKSKETPNWKKNVSLSYRGKERPLDILKQQRKDKITSYFVDNSFTGFWTEFELRRELLTKNNQYFSIYSEQFFH